MLLFEVYYWINKIHTLAEGTQPDLRDSMFGKAKNEIDKIVDMSLTVAKEHVKAIIEASNAKDINKRKAAYMVEKARNITALLQGCYNFMLAWEGEKVISGKEVIPSKKP